MNTMTINGYQAVIAFDPDIQMFRGEFVGLNGGADFYAKDVDGLRREVARLAGLVCLILRWRVVRLRR